MWYLNSTEWYLVETNYDHWLPDPPKDDRRCAACAACECALISADRTIAQAALDQVGEADISLSTLWKVLSVQQGALVLVFRTPPPAVLNDGTTYTAVIVPSNGTLVTYAR